MNLVKVVVKKLLRFFDLKVTTYNELPYNKRILQNYDTYREILSINNIDKIPGSFVELGFGYGRSFVIFGHLSVFYGRKLYGFDSFSGFPKITTYDASSRNPKKNQWKVRTLAEAENFIRGTGLLRMDQYKLSSLVLGSSTSNPIPAIDIALLHIDLDLYEGYKYSLEIFWNNISKGGVVIFDEYNTPEWPGATKAVNEFCAINNISIEQVKSINDKYYLVK
jgi:hypothetical protein